ncbi:MAG: ammonium transporter [Desulfovibrio sp.]|jgi:Amt family ammonium transporter|nr:ammonium transporter [Desulfovibrio sp.]
MSTEYSTSRKAWKAVRKVVPGLALCLIPTLALAQDAPEALSQDNANILWTLIAAILVMFMQAGFACVECGFTRAKSAGNIIMKNFLDFGAGQIVFYFLGFGLMFGTGSSLLGLSHFGLSGVAEADMPWSYTFWFFQSVFAATAATIVSGGIAERTKFGTYVLVSLVVTGVIYPISGHWAWGSLYGDAGWLETAFSVPFCDFAGSSVVHSVGGWLALAGAMVVGPRIGKYGQDGKARAIPGHNIPLAALGVFILWFGWFGFNPGSTTTADSSIGLIAMNTSLAAAAGSLAALAVSWLRFGKPDMSMTMNGSLAGLVGITAPCATVLPGSAILIGLVAGTLVVLSIEFIDKVLRIDDPVGAVSVHGVCGAWGTLSCGLFNTDGGLFFGGGAAQLGVQAVGVVVFFAWAFGTGLLTFSVLKHLAGLRVSEEEERKGLDISEHGSEAYSGFQVFTVE